MKTKWMPVLIVVTLLACFNVEAKTLDGFCSARATTRTAANVSNSEFRGRVSVPELNIVNLEFTSSVLFYSAKPGESAGMVWQGSRQIGESYGTLIKMPEGDYKVRFKDFYYYGPGHEYHCRR